MDRILRRELKQIEKDERSGAAELTQRVVDALQQWMKRVPSASKSQFIEVAKELLHTQPSMGPMLRLANLAAVAADTSPPHWAFAKSLTYFRESLKRARRVIPGLFARACRRWNRIRIHTYSYSSMVAASLIAARSRIEWVECSESRPGLEGRRLAKELSQAGITVQFMTDATLLNETRYYGALLVLGADAVMPSHIVNKVGSDTLVYNFAKRRRPIWILCDTGKFRPGTPYDGSRADTHGGYRELWKDPPRKVTISSPLLDCFPFHKRVRVLTERGWMTPARVRREIAKIKLSPRLKELLD